MALFDRASLVQIPSGYKEGKLYNIKPFDQPFEFERGSAATRVNEDGLIETFHNEATNLLLQSNQFDTTWNAANLDTPTNGFEGYDGSNDAWLISKNNAGGRVEQNISQSGAQTLSIYAKANTSNWLALRVDVPPAAKVGYFDLQNGLVGVSDTGIDTSIESVGNGWYRCTMQFNYTISVVRVYVADSDGAVGATSGSIYIQDAQLEAGYFATPYIDTTTEAVTRPNRHDTPRIDYTNGKALLLEPQRTNEYLNSNDFSLWNTDVSVTDTANQLTSPDGETNATLISVTDSGRIYYDPTISVTADRVLSVFIKAGTFNHFKVGLIGSLAFVDLINETSSIGDIVSIGNGWYRVSLPPTSVSSSSRRAQIQAYPDNTYTNSHGQSGTYYIYGAQLEQGSYATSYIPTNGQTETRLADVCQGGGDESTFNDSEGTIYGELNIKKDGVSSQAFISLSNGDINKRIVLYHNANYAFIFFIENLGIVAQISVNNLDNRTIFKFAAKYKNGDNALFINGSKIATTNTGNIIDFDGLSEFSFQNPNGANKYEGLVKSIAYFPEALTDTELQQLTSNT